MAEQDPETGISLFSTTTVPACGVTQPGAVLRWFGTDTEARYRSEPHPTLGPDDVVYRFNSSGYRGPEFDLSDFSSPPIKVVSIGASEVFGLGLPEEQAFPNVFGNLISETSSRPVVSWNLGVCGASADYNARILYSALEVLKPDVVLLVFPSINRREFISDGGRTFMYPNAFDDEKLRNRIKYRLGDPENASQNAAHRELGSSHNDIANFFKNYQVCASLCREHNVMWAFSSFIHARLAPVQRLLDEDHMIQPGIADFRELNLRNDDDPAVCWARDMGHPGSKSNSEFAASFYQRMFDLYGDRFGDLVNKPGAWAVQQ